MLLGAAVALLATASGSLGQFDLATSFSATLPPELRQRAAKLMTTPPPVAGSGPPASSGLCASPSQWGGDPTGKVDSTAAVQAALAFCVNRSRHINGIFPVGARDAGGCTVDLEGGEYMISTTLRIPAYTSNMEIARGSLVANPKSEDWLEGKPPDAPPLAAGGDACITGFPTNRTGQWCQGMRPGAGKTASLCRAACCESATCNIWQWCPLGAPCANTTGGTSCWLGQSAQCSAAAPTNPKSIGWSGESRPSVPAPPPTPWTGKFMIAVGGDVYCSHPQGSCNEDVGFPQLFLDGSHVANGIQVTSVMGTTIGPTTYLLNFTDYGIQVFGGRKHTRAICYAIAIAGDFWDCFERLYS